MWKRCCGCLRRTAARLPKAWAWGLGLVCIAALATYATYYLHQRSIAHRHALDTIAWIDAEIHALETGGWYPIPRDGNDNIHLSAEDGRRIRRYVRVLAYMPEGDCQAIIERMRRLVYLHEHPEECGLKRREHGSPVEQITVAQPQRPAESGSSP